MIPGLHAGRAVAFAAAGIVLCCTGALQAAQTPSAVFPHKTVVVVVGFSPGGGDGQGGSTRNQGVASVRPQPRYDLIARLYGRHAGRFLAGQPQVQVRHMPGAGSLVAARWLLQDAPRDGSHVATVSGAALTALAGDRPGASIAALTALGAIAGGSYFCARRSGLDAGRPLAFGATSLRERTGLNSAAYAAASGTPVRTIAGYANSVQIALAFRRGEVDGFCGFSLAEMTSQLGDAMAAGRLVPLARFAPPGADGLSHVPRITDIGKKAGPELRNAMALMEWQGAIDWTLLGPPKMDANAERYWRTAYARMVADPDFRRDAVRWGLEVAPAPASSVARGLAEVAKLARQAGGPGRILQQGAAK